MVKKAITLQNSLQNIVSKTQTQRNRSLNAQWLFSIFTFLGKIARSQAVLMRQLGEIDAPKIAKKIQYCQINNHLKPVHNNNIEMNDEH